MLEEEERGVEEVGKEGWNSENNSVREVKGRVEQ